MAQAACDLDAGFCCEVTILWESTVLSVMHLDPGRPYSVGEDESAQPPCDYILPAQKLGMSYLPLVAWKKGRVALALPPGTRGTVDLLGQPRKSISELRELRRTYDGAATEHVLPLPIGAKVQFDLGDFTFRVAMTRRLRPMRHGIQRQDLTMLGYFFLSLGWVSALLGLLAFMTPPLELTEDESEVQSQLFLVQQYLNSPSERERATLDPDEYVEALKTKEGGAGTRAKGEEGSRGSDLVRRSNRSYAIQGNLPVNDVRLARAASIRDARDFGMVGLLRSPAQGDPSIAAAPFGGSLSAGADDESAYGSLWGSELGVARGSGGFGLSGIGEGGGGRGEGIGLGSIIPIGHGAGIGIGEGMGNGEGRLSGCGCGNFYGDGASSGYGRVGGSHKTNVPKVRLGPTEIRGFIPFDVVTRVVSRNLGLVRRCYEQGLAKSPSLEGRVSVRFVIDRDGSVSSVRNGGSDLQDRDVISCVLRSYYGLSFPEPKSGIVTVVYPLEFVRT